MRSKTLFVALILLLVGLRFIDWAHRKSLEQTKPFLGNDTEQLSEPEALHFVSASTLVMTIHQGGKIEFHEGAYPADEFSKRMMVQLLDIAIQKSGREFICGKR